MAGRRIWTQGPPEYKSSALTLGHAASNKNICLSCNATLLPSPRKGALRYEYLSYSVPVCRFRSSSSGLLLATDVAARGLDIPAVEHVIHYQVPKDPDVSSTPTTGVGWESDLCHNSWRFCSELLYFERLIVTKRPRHLNHKNCTREVSNWVS